MRSGSSGPVGSYTLWVTTSAQPLIGVVVDARYRVDGLVARGGMATVYRATDLRLDRTVALKVMHPGLADDPEFVDRFVSEARSAARLTHSSIVAVYDQGTWEGLVYLAMEFVAGQTLRDVLNSEQRLQPAAALAILEPMLEALSAAHRAGFVHRDIKPENVLIAEDGRVKVADFGLARTIATSKTAPVTSGLLIGTVAYLAPEQVERGTADARADVYSAGIVLYEMVVGQAPFVGETPLSVAYQHVHNTVPSPSSIRPGVPSEINDLVAIATASDPASRYADASDFVTHLRMVRNLVGTPEPAQQPSPDMANRTVILNRDEVTVTAGAWPTAVLPSSPISTAPPPTDGPPTVEIAGEPPAPPVDDLAPAEPKRRKPRRFRVLAALLVLILVGAGAGFGTWAYAQGKKVAVPNVVGLTPEQAAAKLTPKELTLNVSGQEFNSKIPKGSIISTDPAAGGEARKGDTVNARTSAGPETVPVPKVRGLTVTRATAKLRAIGLTSVNTEDFSSSIAAGRVISSDPVAGKTIRVGDQVNLVISKGPPPITVPRVVTLDRAAAVAQLEALGLKVVVKNQLPVVVFQRVYSQDPEPGTVVAKGSTVTLTLV